MQLTRCAISSTAVSSCCWCCCLCLLLLCCWSCCDLPSTPLLILLARLDILVEGLCTINWGTLKGSLLLLLPSILLLLLFPAPAPAVVEPDHAVDGMLGGGLTTVCCISPSPSSNLLYLLAYTKPMPLEYLLLLCSALLCFVRRAGCEPRDPVRECWLQYVVANCGWMNGGDKGVSECE